MLSVKRKMRPGLTEEIMLRQETLMPAKPKPRLKRRPPAPKPYHHGDLRRVLIDAALELAEEGGPEAVSVREAARRAGVSAARRSGILKAATR